MKLVSVAEMQAVEREANELGITYEIMMDNAGRNLGKVVADRYEYLKGEGALGLVGSGNNGGDTLVALTTLIERDWPADAYVVRPRPEDDPLIQKLIQAGGSVFDVADDAGLEQLTRLLKSHSVVLDGVLGTGFRLPLKPELGEILKSAREVFATMEEPPIVVAVDCPSGVDCDTGEAAEESIPADLTVTMAAVKQGLLKFPAYNLVGEFEVVGIGLNRGGEEMSSWQAIHQEVVDAEQVRMILPERPLESHKGTFGTAMVVAGSVNYTGAALLAGEAAYRSGAGLVTLAVPSPLHAILAGHLPEATWVLLPDEIGVIASDASEVLLKNLERATALLLGPGFGLEDSTAEFLARLFTDGGSGGYGKIGFVKNTYPNAIHPALPPLVIDADGLKLLARIPDWPSRLPKMTILTLTPGEMSVISGLSTDEIQSDRLAVARRCSQEWGHILVLKGAFTIIAAPDGRAAMIPVASPALARAGSGDVLAGLIVGLRAQGVDAFQAAIAGAWIHAQAGLFAAQHIGNPASVLARDILDATREIINEIC